MAGDHSDPVVLKALRGEYKSAIQAVEEARTSLQASGRVLPTQHEDELAGLIWRHEICVTRSHTGQNELLLSKVQDSGAWIPSLSVCDFVQAFISSSGSITRVSMMSRAQADKCGVGVREMRGDKMARRHSAKVLL